MKGLVARMAVMVMVILLFAQPAYSESLKGRIGASQHWGSGWLDLQVMTSFKQGDKLKLRIGGTAQKIVIRLLSRGDSPDDAVGIDGDVVNVPGDRVVQITLNQDHSDVTQISVHGGPNPWNLFPLGGGNGPATILSAERIAP